jgi:hypothetical protein
MLKTIPFRKIALDDKQWIKERLSKSNFYGCEYSFGNLFIWDRTYHYSVADCEGFFVAKATVNNESTFFFPAGDGDLGVIIRELADDCFQNGQTLKFSNVTSDGVSELERIFPSAFDYIENRNACDYIYLRDKLVTLSGKKLHGKRNHIARFKDNPDWIYEPINSNNIDECHDMSMSWHRKYREDTKNGQNIHFQNEFIATRLAFENFDKLDLDGGLIRLNGRIVAFTMGERLNSDTYVIHIEKAFHDIQGAYAIINQQYAERLPHDIKYINREEDLGVEGLRQAKMSYYPDILLVKYGAVLKEVTL